jgi:hypothetical protein
MLEYFTNFLRRLSGLRPLQPRCSFCRKRYPTNSPFAEGYGGVFICEECVKRCAELIEKEKERLAQSNSALADRE